MQLGFVIDVLNRVLVQNLLKQNNSFKNISDFLCFSNYGVMIPFPSRWPLTSELPVLCGRTKYGTVV